MHTSCAMMASSVTPFAENEGVEVDGVVEAVGAAVSVRGCLGRNCVALHRMVDATVAHMKVK